jgi:hypothetical protein
VTLFREKIKQCSNLLQHYIIDHRYVDTHPLNILNTGAEEKMGDFSMLRLKDIAEQRSLYSSVDDIVYAHDSDSDFDEPDENSKDPNNNQFDSFSKPLGFELDLAIPQQKHEQMTPFADEHSMQQMWYIMSA